VLPVVSGREWTRVRVSVVVSVVVSGRGQCYRWSVVVNGLGLGLVLW